MRKIVFGCLFIFLMISFEGFAQEKPFLFGMKLSPNIGWMNSNSVGYDNEGVKAGISWGLITQIHLMENYDLHTGINISLLRSAINYPDIKTIGSTPVEGELHRLYSLKYIGIPLTFRMKTNEFAKKRFFGQIGIELNFLIAANAKDKFNSEGSGQVNEEINIYNELRFPRYALIVGGGMEYSLGGSNMLITGLNFNNGINDVLKDQNKINPSITQNAISNFVEFYVSFLF
jgi:hypothetical protein